jgi:hypothetical protein
LEINNKKVKQWLSESKKVLNFYENEKNVIDPDYARGRRYEDTSRACFYFSNTITNFKKKIKKMLSTEKKSSFAIFPLRFSCINIIL